MENILKISLAFLILFALPAAAEDAIRHTDVSPLQNLNIAQQQILEQIKGLSILTAFLGGALLFFAPCSIGLLPAFLAYTFKERERLAFATLSFFFGFAAVNSFLGLGASIVGSWLIFYQPVLTNIAALLLIAFGIMAIFGKSIGFFKVKKTPGSTFAEMFLFGAAFSVGYAGCSGPIMLAILTVASLQPLLDAALLMFFYSLGLVVPLLIVSYYFDKSKIFKRLAFFGSTVRVGKSRFPIANVVAGALFITLGLVYFLFSGTGVFMQLPLEISQPIYDFVYGLQRGLLSLNIPLADIVFAAAAVILLSLGIRKYYWLNHGKKRK